MAEVNFLVKKGLTVPKGSASTPSVIFDASDPNTGLYSPGADQVAVATNGAGRVFVDASGRIGIAGSPSASSNTYLQVGYAGIGSDHVAYNYDSYFANNLYKSANSAWSRISTRAGGLLRIDDDTFTYSTADSGTAGASATLSERLRITSAGFVGIGVSAPGDVLHVKGGSTYAGIIADNSAATGGGAFRAYRNGVQKAIFCADSWVTGTSSDDAAIYADAGGGIKFYTNNSSTAKAVLTSGGSVGIGTTTSTTDCTLSIGSGALNFVGNSTAPNASTFIYRPGDNSLGLGTDGTERARFDPSGRLLVGTSSARLIEPYGLGNQGQVANIFEGVADTDPGPGLALCSNSATAAFGPYLYLCRSGAATVGSNTVVASGANLGTISFAGADGTDLRTRGGTIHCEVDGTPGANDIPGKLVLSTTAAGATAPTPRMTIKASGIINFSNAPVYADNAAALAGGLVAGDVYRKADGTLMITF